MYDNSPLGKYHYKRILMGISNSPDIFQQKMNGLFHGLEFICAYIDNVLVSTKGNRKNHVQKLELTLS